MKQWTHKEFAKVVRHNGFSYDRHSGSHIVYINKDGRHISIPHNLQCVIAYRLIKENNLEINIKRRR